jgi:predicted nucleotidyltransferase
MFDELTGRSGGMIEANYSGARTETAWQVTPAKVREAVQRIVAACDPDRVLVFGSYAAGRADADSDLDMLVVMPGDVDDPHAESVRLRRALSGINMCVDILVISRRRLEELQDVPGLVYREAVRNGKVLYERSQGVGARVG